MAIEHQCENGQRVSYPTAESSVVEDGYVKFFDVHGNEVGRQPVPEVVVVAPPPNPPGSLGSGLTEEEKKENESHDDSKPADPDAGSGSPAPAN
jgi:hypothetical protein